MRLSEIRERTDEELGRLAHQTETTLFKLRVQRHTSQLGSPMEIRKARRTLARVLTILAARRRGTEVAGAPIPAGGAPAKPQTVEEAMALEGGAPAASAAPERPKARAAAKKGVVAKKAKPAAAKDKKTTKTSKPAARAKTAKARTSRGGK